MIVWEILITTPPQFTVSSIVLPPLTCQELGSIINSLIRLMELSVGHLLENKQTARRMLDIERAVISDLWAFFRRKLNAQNLH